MRLMQYRNSNPEYQVRTLEKSNLRVRADSDDGIIEGYPVTWNHVDSYKSMFIRGCFAESIAEKLPGKRIKALNQHNVREPIGVVIEATEDDIGLFIRAKLNIEKQLARDVFSDIRSETLNSLSFGFTISRNGDRYRNGIQEIVKAELFEVSPVTFPASDRAVITGFRATDFGETKEQLNASNGVNRVMRTLEETVFDIFYQMVYQTNSNDDVSQYIEMIENCCNQFSDEMVAAFQKYIDVFRPGNSVRSMPEIFSGTGENRINAITEFRKYVDGFDSVDSMLQETSFTREEYKRLAYPNGELSHRDLGKIKENCPNSIYIAFRSAAAPTKRQKPETENRENMDNFDEEINSMFSDLNKRFFKG